jgi:hypothetical protein
MSWETQTANHARQVAATEKAVRQAAAKLGFRADTKFRDRDCVNLGTVRIAYYSDDERCEVYAFDGKPGDSCLKYEVGLSYGVPADVIVATITKIVETELR